MRGVERTSVFDGIIVALKQPVLKPHSCNNPVLEDNKCSHYANQHQWGSYYFQPRVPYVKDNQLSKGNHLPPGPAQDKCPTVVQMT